MTTTRPSVLVRGNFQAYQENKVARLGEDAARPHRLHKKLVRG